MSRYVSYRDFDWVLMTFVLILCALGVLQIHSATEHTKFAGAHIRQIYWVVAGVGAMFLVSLINYQALLERIHWIYIAALASLVSVLLFGQKYLGARRWIKLPWNVHFQPSEWVKLILILAVAKYFADLHTREVVAFVGAQRFGAPARVAVTARALQPEFGGERRGRKRPQRRRDRRERPIETPRLTQRTRPLDGDADSRGATRCRVRAREPVDRGHAVPAQPSAPGSLTQVFERQGGPTRRRDPLQQRDGR